MKLHPDVTSTRTIKAFSTLQERFIAKFGTKFNYSLFIYVSTKSKSIIICPIHNEFEQSSQDHLASKYGCPKCGTEATAIKQRKTLNTFIQEAKIAHGDRYNYSKSLYVNVDTPIEIICENHGSFWQAPHYHTSGGNCAKCMGNGILTHEEFLVAATSVHRDKYQYIEKFKTSKTKITIVCKDHGEFVQQAFSHLNGNGCPSCAKYGFQPNKSAILYYISINNGEAYKIGITNRTVKERFGPETKHIIILKEVYYESGQDAYDAEQQILRDHKASKYNGPDLLQSGNTELFTHDILNLAPI